MSEHTHDEIVAAVLEGCCPDCHARLAVTGACPNGDGYWSATASGVNSSYRYTPDDGQFAGSRLSFVAEFDPEFKRLLLG